jgi:hypothetical protein
MNALRCAAIAAAVIFLLEAPTFANELCGGTIRGQMKLDSDVVCAAEGFEIIGPANVNLNGFTVDCGGRMIQINGHSVRMSSGILRNCSLLMGGNKHRLFDLNLHFDDDCESIATVIGHGNTLNNVRSKDRCGEGVGLTLIGNHNRIADSAFPAKVLAFILQGNANMIIRSAFKGEGGSLEGNNNVFNNNIVDANGELSIYGTRAQIKDNILIMDGWSFNIHADRSNITGNVLTLLEFSSPGIMNINGNNNVVTRNVVEADGRVSVSGMFNLLIRNRVEGDRGRMEDHNIGCDANRWIMNSAATSNQACVGTGVVVE